MPTDEGPTGAVGGGTPLPLPLHTRRSALGAAAAALGALALGLLRPLTAWAAWNQAAFDTKDVFQAIKLVGAGNAEPSPDIVINAPEIAENGAQVPIEIQSNVPGTETIYIFADKNVQPYVGNFTFTNGAEPYIATRIKMGETCDLRVVVRAGGKFYVATREVKVTIGGCGT